MLKAIVRNFYFLKNAKVVCSVDISLGPWRVV